MQKIQSSMTLFLASSSDSPWTQVLFYLLHAKQKIYNQCEWPRPGKVMWRTEEIVFLLKVFYVLPLLWRATGFRDIWIFLNPLNLSWNSSKNWYIIFYTIYCCSTWKNSHYCNPSINFKCKWTWKSTEDSREEILVMKAKRIQAVLKEATATAGFLWTNT